jgi:hypothetical protein
MARRPVGSREYKVMLRPERFAGSEDEVRETVGSFWADVGRVLDGLDVPTDGSFDTVKARRRIRFLDTEDRLLDGNRYLFRERVDVETDEREMTLKFRHPDRYVAEDRDMDAEKGHDDVETKFEEDVKPPFVSVFSYSTTVVVDADREFERLGAVFDFFPGLADGLRDPASDGALTVVRDFCARELVLEGAFLLLGRRDAEAECAMVIWHDDADGESATPCCVEFSFKYGDDDEDYKGSVARDAHDVLRALAAELPEWVHPEPTTKSLLVFG